MGRKSLLGTIAAIIATLPACATSEKIKGNRTNLLEYVKQNHTTFSSGTNVLAPELEVKLNGTTYQLGVELDQSDNPQLIYLNWKKELKADELPTGFEDRGSLEDSEADGTCDTGYGQNNEEQINFNRKKKKGTEYEKTFQEFYDDAFQKIEDWIAEQQPTKTPPELSQSLAHLTDYIKLRGSKERHDELFEEYTIERTLKGNTEEVEINGIPADTHYKLMLVDTQKHWLPKILNIQSYPILQGKPLHTFFIELEDRKTDGTCDRAYRFLSHTESAPIIYPAVHNDNYWRTHFEKRYEQTINALLHDFQREERD